MTNVKLSELREHPRADIIPAMTSEQFASLVSSIALSGIIRPLDVKRDGDKYIILDGRCRFRAATHLGLEQLPINIVSPADDILYMIDSAIERRDLTAGQRDGLVLERADYVASVVSESEKARKETEGRPQLDKTSENYKLGALVPPVIKTEKERKKGERSTRGKLARQAGTSARTMSQVKKAKAEAPDLYVRIMTGEISAKRAEDELRRRQTDPNKWKQQHFNVWQAFEIEDFQHKYPGQLPAELLRNVLYYTTVEGDTVLDVFGGGGNMGLVCQERNRNCITFDIDPKFPNIIKHNALQPFPALESGLVDMVFLDPPYGSQKKGEYATDPADLSNMNPQAFYDAMDLILAHCTQVVKPSGYIVLIVGASQKGADYQDHALEIYSRWRARMRLVNRVTCAYPTSQYNPPQMNQYTEAKIMLNLRTDILFWKFPAA